MIAITSPTGRDLTLRDGATRIMGVLNVTPDSFSDGGRFTEPAAAVQHAVQMVEAGASVIDVGAESTRPGYVPATVDDQLDRIMPVLESLRGRVEVPISIDTTRAAVADATLRAGADWINDTTALREDPELAGVVAQHGCPIVLMHRFAPARCAGDQPPPGRALVEQVADALTERLEHAVASGIAVDRVLLDPGIGFGTLAEDNVAVLAHIDELRALGRPLVVGPSRKSFLGHLTGRDTDSRLPATGAAVMALALAGVELVRVHDVAEMRDVVLVAAAIRRARGA